jgi:prepilin-type N-terminal cleavage/methylation domain-containing protein
MKKSPGFTILELLVSMAVLAIILVMLLQVVNGLLQSTRTQNQQMDSVASARRALDVMAADLQNAVVGDSSAILVPAAAGSNLFALLAARRGPNGSASPRFLPVSYFTNSSNQLVRSYGSVDFGQTDFLAAATNTLTTPVEPLAKGILGIQVRAITEATNFAIPAAASPSWATNNYNGLTVPGNWLAVITRSPVFASSLTNRTRALEIWIAAVDDQNFQILKDSSKLAVAQSLLAGTATNWRSALDNSTIPNQTKSGIRILNKSIPLP